MRIAMIGHKRIPSREGGVEIVVEELSVRMASLGHDVTVFNRAGHHVSGKDLDACENKLKDYKGVKLIRIPTFQARSLNAIVYAILATLRSLFGKFDIIHYHAEGSCALLWIPRLFHKKTIATIHGLDWERAKWGGFAARFLMFGEKMAVKYADQIIVLSKNVQEYFADQYQRETIYIPNGIVRPNENQPEIILEKYGLHGDDYILFLARVVPEKGAHYLIEAFQKANPNKKLVIAGGASHSDQYFSDIEKMVADDSRIIMTGFIQGQELEELYSNCSLYVLPSDVEGMPLSLLEALSYGNLCLVSNIKENLEVIEGYGHSFNHGDVEDLKNKLLSLESVKLNVQQKKQIQDYVCNRFNWDQITMQTLDLYRKVL